MYSMRQFRKRAVIEQGMKGGKLLDLFAKNPNGRPVGYNKKIPTINVYLPASSVAAVDKADKANRRRSSRRINH